MIPCRAVRLAGKCNFGCETGKMLYDAFCMIHASCIKTVLHSTVQRRLGDTVETKGRNDDWQAGLGQLRPIAPKILI